MASISFARLPEIALDEVRRLLNDPRNARHMPLATAMDDDGVAAWVRGKDAQWDDRGFGPWAVLVDGAFAGWGGFQDEDGDADFALVLDPRFWGHGAEITRLALDAGFDDLGFDDVTIALPYSRRADRVVERFGFVGDGDAEHGGTRFRRYRLTRARWASVAASGG